MCERDIFLFKLHLAGHGVIYFAIDINHKNVLNSVGRFRLLIQECHQVSLDYKRPSLIDKDNVHLNYTYEDKCVVKKLR